MLRKKTTELAFTKKRKYFVNQISDCPSSKALFSCVNRLTDNTKPEILPSHDSPRDLANSFNTFFKEKIQVIRRNFPSVSPSYHGDMFSGELLELFRPTSLEEVKAIISKHGLKCSSEDPLPEKLLSYLTDTLLPVWVELINLSLEQGSIDCLKSAVVIPLLKGLDSVLDNEVFKNYRPVSTLQLLGKIIERIVDYRLDEHIEKNSLDCSSQYGYKRNHSTETLLMKIVNDMLLACDNNTATLLMLLDLSAAFDTVDPDKMLLILEKRYGVRGIALKWFASFLKGRSQKVTVKGELSDTQLLDCGVPQGSILGPKLFNLYAQSFTSTMKSKVDVNVEGYADDHQVQKQFGILFQFKFLSDGIENIYRVAEEWMIEYFLKINGSKTLIMIVAPPAVKEKILINGTFIGGCCIRFVTQAKNLGVLLDSYLRFDFQIKKVVKSCYMALRKIARIKRFLYKDQLVQLSCALVFSQIDYCNALYYLVNSYSLKLLQSVQNSAARLVCGVTKFHHIPSDELLQGLHWLKVIERIEYKIITIVHKCLHGKAPIDLASSLVLSRSDRTFKLNIPHYKSHYGERCFAVSGPKLWNMLPIDIRIITNTDEFKKKLKTHLFKKCYHLY